VVLPYYLVHVEKHVCLSHDVYVTGVGIAGSDEDRGRSRRFGTEDWGWSSTSRVLDGRTIERLGEHVCGLHHAIGVEEHEFLSLTSKLRSTVSLGLASKPVATALVVWPQNYSLGFPGLGLKTGSCDLVIWPTKSPRWFFGLCLKNKWAIVCQLRHKTDRTIKTMQDTHRDLAAGFA
jgi:hypothetical protein